MLLSKSIVAKLCALLIAAALAFVLHIGLGSSSAVNLVDVLRELFAGYGGDEQANVIVWQLRMPRAVGCALIGAILGAAGSAFQSLFRNPLAEPYVLGVSSGAGIGGTVALMLGVSGAAYGLGKLGLAFVGGMLTLWLVVAIARKGGRISITTMLIAGVVVSAMLASAMTAMLLAAGQDTNQILRWLLGTTADLQWPRVETLAVVLLVCLAVLQTQTRALNAFSVGEFTSERLGVDVPRLRAITLLTVTLMTAMAVGSAGIIGFLGLVAPHIARRIVGLDLRISLLGSALTGTAVLLFADVIAQRAFEFMELPLGAVTAIIGAPMLLALLRKQR
ncbi:MAG: iron ABC transporter permease [Armatimonadetes bacterium]|nr:iron ABC transporter permease [Armatimonadota bacterium]